jgi:LGFP repeat
MWRGLGKGMSVKRFVLGSKGLLVAALALGAVAAAGRPAAAHPIADKYNSLAPWQRQLLGNASTGYVTVPGGMFGSAVYQEFRGGVIWWDFAPGSGTYVLFGNYWKWQETGRWTGYLGRPLSDELLVGDNRGSYSRYQHGFITWTKETGFHMIFGEIAQLYDAKGKMTGIYGYPVTDHVVHGVGNHVQFERGYIYWSPQTGAHGVRGAFLDKWRALGWEWGALGYPKSDAYTLSDGTVRQDFERGFLYQSPGFPVQVGDGPAPRAEWVWGSTRALPYSRDLTDMGASTVHNDTLYIFYGDGPRHKQYGDYADPIGFIPHPSGFVSDLAPLGSQDHVINDGSDWCPYRIRFAPGNPMFRDGRRTLLVGNDPGTEVAVQEFYDHGGTIVPRQDQLPGGAFSYAGKCYTFVGLALDKGHTTEKWFLGLACSPDPAESKGVFDWKMDLGDAGLGFQHIAPYVVTNSQIPGLPQTNARDGLIMIVMGWLPVPGTTDWAPSYRVAWIPLRLDSAGEIAPRPEEFRFYRGGGGDPWVKDPRDAKKFFDTPKDWTAISLDRIPRTGQWIVLYQKTLADFKNQNPAVRHEGIYARIGSTPWNWSKEVCIFNPDREQAWQSGFMKDVPGGFAYGAFLLHPYIEWIEGQQTVKIRYLMSTGQPYRTVVMESQIKISD